MNQRWALFDPNEAATEKPPAPAQLYLKVEGHGKIIEGFRLLIENLLALGRSQELITYELLMEDRQTPLEDRQERMKANIQGHLRPRRTHAKRMRDRMIRTAS